MRPLITTIVLALATAAFVAPGAHAADTCPNAQYRKGDGAKLPGCRAWEQATPVDKGGSQPIDVFGALSSPSGDRVISGSPGNIGGAEGGPYNGTFASFRGASWTTFGVDPPVDARPVPFFDVVARLVVGFSEDRSKALVVSLRKLTPEAVEGDSNLYVRDTADGTYTFAARTSGSALYSALTNTDTLLFHGASSDFKHIAFSTTAALVPGARDDEAGPNLYLISNGQITLASQDSNGEALNTARESNPDSGPRLVSDDGRRVTFSALGFNDNFFPALFQRVDGNSTVQISHSYRTGDDPNARIQPAGSVWPSRDGTEVTFGTARLAQLTNEGPPSPLYRWRAGPNGGTLTNLLVGVSPPWTTAADQFSLLRMSPDGRYLWFTLLDSDQNGDQRKELAVLDTQRKQVDIKASAPNTGAFALFPDASARFSPDGRHMLGLTDQPLTQYDNVNPDGPCNSSFGGGSNVCLEAFAFDATQPGADPVCVSCGPAGTHSLGDAEAGLSAEGRPLPIVVTDDGTMFFDTPQPLAASDANRLADVYEYTPGRAPVLLSSGTSTSPSIVGSTSASGNDLFFITSDRLVAQDDDDAADVYDARVGGGLAAQQVARVSGSPCPTGVCPGSQAPVPGAQTPGTTLVRGPNRPPSFSVSRVSAAARNAAASTGRLRVAVKVGAAGRLSARASARLGRRTKTIGRASTSVSKAGRVTLTLSLSSSARRALVRDRKLAVALSVSYSRASKAAAQSFTLTTPRSPRSTKGGAR